MKRSRYRGVSISVLIYKSLITIFALLLAFIEATAIDSPHFDLNRIGCDSCHFVRGSEPSLLPPWTSHVPQDIDDTQYNTLCWSCHNDIDSPYVKTHSSLQIDNSYGNWTVECRVCHNPHYHKQFRTYGSASYLYSGQSTGISSSTLTKTGAGWALNAYQGMLVVPNVSQMNYNYKILSNTSDTLTVQGPLNLSKAAVGNTFAIVYGKLVNDTVKLSQITTTPAKSGSKPVRFFNSTGANSFADGNAVYDGICEVCHTQTKYHDDIGSGASHNSGTNCMTCHNHTRGFGHGAGEGTECVDCHGTTGSHAPHLNNADILCDACHDTNRMPGFNSGFDSNGNGRIDLYETDVCNLCHHDGTYVSTGVRVVVSPKSDWGSSLGCGGCHKYGPDYENRYPKANTHFIHRDYVCSDCHSATTTTNNSITNTSNHLNNVYNLQAGGGASFTYTYDAGGGSCSSVSCHGGTYARWGGTACLDCHNISQGSRAAITSQFSANSHHIQGAVTNEKCYQCHWEANTDGSINSTHHGGSGASGSAVDLVIYGAGSRPSTYNAGTTAVQYMANGTRTEIQRINSHCLGCHSDQNNSTTPFGDGKTPRQYAWDGNSVEARYSQTGTTSWGKYSSITYPNVTPKDKRTKAFSAHGNAVNNEGGWDLNETWPNTRNGAVNVACFDCHNSHGSAVSGTTTSYMSATVNGGILKDTSVNKGGYSVDYKPSAGGTAENRNLRNAGASLCLDCHLNADGNSAAMPWGYQTTFGGSQAIIGYFDSPYLAPGSSGMQQRYAYKALRQNAGGHFGASSALSTTPMGTIGGLCTPCHDPHGVSPTNIGICSNPAYVTKADCQSGGGLWTPAPENGVPMLKGTWMTSPYKEDVAPVNNALGTVRDSTYPMGHDGTPREGVKYRIDQNTFGANIRASVTGVTETANRFAGLCLNCHTKNSLTDGVNGGTWRSVDRIHESVKGWGANVRHNYTCSKCHAPHNGSALPRLMITNCLDSRHKGRSGNNSSPILSGSGNCDDYSCYGEAQKIGFGWWEEAYAFASGGGQFPGSWSGYYPGSYGVTCHENRAADQSWNNVTPWVSGPPALTSPAATSVGSTNATLGATITSDGSFAITARGTVWGTSVNPTTNPVAEGGTTTGVFTHARTGLPGGTLIYYRGYATNSAGTGYSPNGSFYTEPSTQASGVNFTSVGSSGMTVNWSRGSGDGVIVLMRQGSAVATAPTDGTYTTYSASAVFGSGTVIGSAYVIYKGTGTSLTVSGLAVSTTYYVAVYEYKGTANTSETYQGTNYKSGPATGSQATTAATVPTLTSPTATSIGSTNATLGANVTDNGGSALTARGTVWGTSANPTGNATAQGGTTTGVFTHGRTGLTAGMRIYYRGYATNNMGTGYSSNGSFYTEPSTQASGVNFTSVGSSDMTVNWSRGSGDGVIVLMRQGSAVVTAPTDGAYTTYSASAVFGNGTAIGPAFVIYKGTGTSVAVSGLTASMTYYVSVYEYKGTVNTSGVDQGTNYKSGPATGSRATSSGGPGNTATFQITHMVNCYGGTYNVNAGNIIWAGPFWDDYEYDCDVDRTFLMFDTSSLGSGVTITSARLYLDFQNRDYLWHDAVTNVHSSSWTYPPGISTCSNVGTFLASNTVLVSQPFGLTTFILNTSVINKNGNTMFAVKGDNESVCDNLDPGYNRATTYLEVDYTSN